MGRFVDLTGKRFDRLVVQKYAGNYRWVCLCDCGQLTEVRADQLKCGNTRSCGCLLVEAQHEHVDITGLRSGRLVAQTYVSKSRWLCLCDCGNTAIVGKYDLEKQKTRSCGCLAENPGPRLELDGQRFGRLVVASYDGCSKWSCICDCGGIAHVETAHLTRGVTKSCGCLQKEPRNNLKGAQFGRLTVEEYLGTSKWRCSCSCGNTAVVNSALLSGGHTKSCGCLHKEWVLSHIAVKKYGDEDYADTKQVWSNMLRRCYYEDARGYDRYGGRGITVCDAWHDFGSFLRDMGVRPSKEHTIERIDNDGHYEPDNCKWATWHEQHRNKRTNRIITLNGVTRILKDWAEDIGILPTTLAKRIRNGWPLEIALSAPSGTRVNKSGPKPKLRTQV